MSDVATALTLALATLASEDVAAIAAAALAADGHIGMGVATTAVTLGIYVGDLLLFACGRASVRVHLIRSWLAKRWSSEELRAVGVALDQRLATAVVTSRFLPGARLPMYVAAGMFSRRPAAFCAWTFVAVAIWTPLLISGVSLLGESFEIAAHSYLRWAPALTLLVATHVTARFIARRKAR